MSDITGSLNTQQDVEEWREAVLFNIFLVYLGLLGLALFVAVWMFGMIGCMMWKVCIMEYGWNMDDLTDKYDEEEDDEEEDLTDK